MSKTKLKKTLQSMAAEELVGVIMELYESRKEAKDYLEYWLAPDADKELEKCCKSVERQFFTTAGVHRRSPSLPDINKVVKNFMTLCYEPDKVAELLLFIPERMGDWLEERYRRISYRSSLRKYLTEAKLYIETHDLTGRYGLRLERLNEKVEAIEKWQENHAPRRWRRWRY
ncbi:MAG: hypothetical protein K2J15_06100 [Muribaculaceae bacterium]|nr:hypothetical protein [Muribaculaceae bacterium]